MTERTWASFGKALATARLEAGYPSQACLGRAVGLQAVEVCRFEGGSQLPSLRTFARLTGAGLDPLPLLAALDPEPAPPAEQGTAHDPDRQPSPALANPDPGDPGDGFG
jgi:hypothetical protein